jgi:predicted MFS family arabinose efflux permease
MLTVAAFTYAIYGATGGEFDRELLGVFDALLVVVLGLVLYAMSAREPARPAGLMDAVGLLAVAAALVPGTRPTTTRRAAHSSRRSRPSRAVVALWLAFGLGSAPALAAFAQAGDLADDAAAVTLAVALLNLGNFGGRLIAGPLSDRIGRRAALHANSGLLVLACVPLALGASGALALAALLLLGTQYGALSTLTPAATSDVVPAERFGTTYGLVFTGWGIAGLAAPVAAATLATVIGYGAVYLAFLAIAALSWAAVLAYARLAAGHG